MSWLDNPKPKGRHYLAAGVLGAAVAGIIAGLLWLLGPQL